MTDDPCTISSQIELFEAIKLTLEFRDAELKVFFALKFFLFYYPFFGVLSSFLPIFPCFTH